MLELPDWSVVTLVLWAARLLLTMLLVANTDLWNHSRFAWPLGVGVGLAGVGTVFKIEHWTAADALLLTGAGLVAGACGWWFAQKPLKLVLSYLKLAWVLSGSASVLAWVVCHPAIRPLAAVATAAFWAAALLLVYQRWIRRDRQVPD